MREGETERERDQGRERERSTEKERERECVWVLKRCRGTHDSHRGWRAATGLNACSPTASQSRPSEFPNSPPCPLVSLSCPTTRKLLSCPHERHKELARQEPRGAPHQRARAMLFFELAGGQGYTSFTSGLARGDGLERLLANCLKPQPQVSRPLSLTLTLSVSLSLSGSLSLYISLSLERERERERERRQPRRPPRRLPQDPPPGISLSLSIHI